VLEEFEDTKGAIRIHKEKFEDTTIMDLMVARSMKSTIDIACSRYLF
jgi:hypothetical protein